MTDCSKVIRWLYRRFLIICMLAWDFTIVLDCVPKGNLLCYSKCIDEHVGSCLSNDTTRERVVNVVIEGRLPSRQLAIGNGRGM